MSWELVQMTFNMELSMYRYRYNIEKFGHKGTPWHQAVYFASYSLWTDPVKLCYPNQPHLISPPPPCAGQVLSSKDLCFQNRLEVMMQVIRNLQNEQGFSYSIFGKTLNKQVRVKYSQRNIFLSFWSRTLGFKCSNLSLQKDLPLEFAWRMHTGDIMPYDVYVTRYSRRPVILLLLLLSLPSAT